MTPFWMGFMWGLSVVLLPLAGLMLWAAFLSDAPTESCESKIIEEEHCA